MNNTPSNTFWKTALSALASFVGCLLLPMLDHNDSVARYGEQYSIWSAFDAASLVGTVLYGSAIFIAALGLNNLFCRRVGSVQASVWSAVVSIPVGLIGMALTIVVGFSLYYLLR
jgi:hypothetical protein